MHEQYLWRVPQEREDKKRKHQNQQASMLKILNNLIFIKTNSIDYIKHKKYK